MQTDNRKINQLREELYKDTEEGKEGKEGYFAKVEDFEVGKDSSEAFD